jgi:hypothetical protein
MFIVVWFMNQNAQRLQFYVSLIRDIITGISALIVAIVAVIGLGTWKKQLKGKTEYEIAQKLLRAVYRVRRAINVIRNPFIGVAEIREAMNEANMVYDPGAHVNNALNHELVFQKRWRGVLDAFVDMDAYGLEAETLWGQVVHERLQPLRQSANELYRNIMMLLTHLNNQELNNNSPEIRRIRELIYISPNDTFGRDFNDAVTQIEIFLKPKLNL